MKNTETRDNNGKMDENKNNKIHLILYDIFMCIVYVCNGDVILLLLYIFSSKRQSIASKYRNKNKCF